MGFDQKLKDLLRLQITQPDAFTAELDEPWPGMQSDIELASGSWWSISGGASRFG